MKVTSATETQVKMLIRTYQL